MRKELGERIKLLRVLSGLKQETFAYIVGVSQKTIVTIETGIHSPNPQVREKLSKLFSVNENWLLTGNGNAFTDSIVYFCPTLLFLSDQKKAGEVERAINALLPKFIKAVSPKKIYEVQINRGLYYSFGYVLVFSPLTFMFIDALTFPKIISSVLQNQKFQYEILKIEKIPSKAKKYLPKFLLIYSFLYSMRKKYGNYEELYNNYLKASEEKINFKRLSIIEGLSGYVLKILQENFIDINEFAEFLKKQHREENNDFEHFGFLN